MVRASSVHATGRYESTGRVPIDPARAPAPCCAHGATEGFDEAIADVQADRGAVSTVGPRLGATAPEPTRARDLSGWLGPADLRQLVTRTLETDVRCGVCAGVSANTRQRRDPGNARAELEHRPVLDSEVCADAVEQDGGDTCACRRR